MNCFNFLLQKAGLFKRGPGYRQDPSPTAAGFLVAFLISILPDLVVTAENCYRQHVIG